MGFLCPSLSFPRSVDYVFGQRFQPSDIKWLSVLYQRLRAQVRGKVPFVQHTRVDDFRFIRGDRCTVALVSDWGTGNVNAAAVASQISHRDPDHVIHLGDVCSRGFRRARRDGARVLLRAEVPHDVANRGARVSPPRGTI